MPRKERKTQKQFGSSAGAQEIAKFGSMAAGSKVYSNDPEVIQALTQYAQGWYGATVGLAPTIEDHNALDYVWAYQLFYLLQAGVPEWDAETEYFTGNLVSSGNQYGEIYVCLADSNTNHAITDTNYWRKLNGQVTSVKTSNFTLAAADNGCIIPVDTTSGAVAITLVTGGAPKNFSFTVVDVAGTFATNAVTITRIASEKINNVTSNYLCKVSKGFWTFVSNGTDWYVTAKPAHVGLNVAQATAHTLTYQSAEEIYITSPASAINQDLPSTGVIAGQKFRLEVSSATTTNSVTLRSAAGNNIDTLVATGHIWVQALQNTPTSAAHWKILSLRDSGRVTITPALESQCTIGAFPTWLYDRNMNDVSLEVTGVIVSANNGATMRWKVTLPTSMASAFSAFSDAVGTCVWANGVYASGYAGYNGTANTIEFFCVSNAATTSANTAHKIKYKKM